MIAVLVTVVGLLMMVAFVAATVQTLIEILPAPLGCLVFVLFLLAIMAIIF